MQTLATGGDNMRNVAVTEGDKTEAERVFGASINTWAVNELCAAYVGERPAAGEADRTIGRQSFRR